MSAPELIAQLFQALADPTRLALLWAVRNGSPCATDLHTALGMSQPRVARHLKILVEAGLLLGRREGRFVRYTLPDSGTESRIVQAALAGLADAGPVLPGSAIGRSPVRRGPAAMEEPQVANRAAGGGRPPGGATGLPAGTAEAPADDDGGDTEAADGESADRGMEDFLL